VQSVAVFVLDRFPKQIYLNPSLLPNFWYFWFRFSRWLRNQVWWTATQRDPPGNPRRGRCDSHPYNGKTKRGNPDDWINL